MTDGYAWLVCASRKGLDAQVEWKLKLKEIKGQARSAVMTGTLGRYLLSQHYEPAEKPDKAASAFLQKRHPFARYTYGATDTTGFYAHGGVYQGRRRADRR